MTNINRNCIFLAVYGTSLIYLEGQHLTSYEHVFVAYLKEIITWINGQEIKVSYPFHIQNAVF